MTCEQTSMTRSDDPVSWRFLRPQLSGESIFIAAMHTLPIMMAPVIVVSNIFWAKFEFAERHREQVSWETPSVSQTLVDAYVGEIFALWMWPTAILLTYAVYRVGQLHLHFLAGTSPGSQDGPPNYWYLIPLAFLFQVIAAIGMILLSQYTSNINIALHLAGSYMLFIGYAISIPISGFICHRLKRANGGKPACLNLALNSIRIVMSATILLGTLVYFVVYTIRNEPLPVPEPIVHSFVVNFEVFLLVMFVVYLASFALEQFHFECARRIELIRDRSILSGRNL